MQEIYLGYVYSRWRKIRGIDKDNPVVKITSSTLWTTRCIRLEKGKKSTLIFLILLELFVKELNF